MDTHAIPGLAVAITDGGEVTYLKTFGVRRRETAAPLTADTVMYGASITKLVFAALVMQLEAEGRIDIDRPIGELLPKPLPDYERFTDLAGDARWRQLTLRMLLSHTSGFPNYRFFREDGTFDADGKLAFAYDPDARYGYSGEGYYLAQLVVEEALGLETEAELQARFFRPLGMTRTSLLWQEHARPDFAVGYTRDGENKGHNMQSNARAAGSMDTTITDLSRFMAAFMGGTLINPDARARQLAPGMPILSDHQFPTLAQGSGRYHREAGLSAGVGVVLFDGPQGRGFVKGGHNEKTDNMMQCLIAQARCVILLSNAARGDLIFPQIFEAALGDTGMPWAWEYNSLQAD
jgi:CubicO group peptidase (beta-lactamase class C family)